MSRNRYTKIIHQEQRRQIARQEKELAVITWRLRHQDTEAAVTPESPARKRRRTRLERQALDKPVRYAVTADSSSPTMPVTTGIAA